jgi:hypothetical protein
MVAPAGDASAPFIQMMQHRHQDTLIEGNSVVGVGSGVQAGVVFNRGLMDHVTGNHHTQIGNTNNLWYDAEPDDAREHPPHISSFYMDALGAVTSDGRIRVNDAIPAAGTETVNVTYNNRYDIIDLKANI